MRKQVKEYSMKNITDKLCIMTLLFTFCLISSAFAGDWIQVMPLKSGEELIQHDGNGYEKAVQIGNSLIISSGENFKDAALKKSPSNILALRPGEKTYLITTKDPAILNATFPGARIVHREMGFIVVVAGETAAMNLISKRSDFTSVELMPENEVILTAPVKCKHSAHKSADPISKFLNLLDMQAFMKDLSELVAFKTRYSYVAPAQKSIDHCEKIFKELGYKTSQEPFTIGSVRTHNLVAEITGKDPEKSGEVLVVGHLDSTSPNPRNDAPGADDNGSGAAGVIALARMLRQSEIQPDATIKFILFMGEEQGLLGSKAYVKALSAEARKKIRAVLNLDMIGFDAVPPLSILMETNSFNRPMMEIMQAMAAKYSNCSIQVSYKAWGSDHAPFLNVQIPAVLTIESEFATNPHYHQVTDRVEVINPELCEAILRINAATMYKYAIAAENK